MPGPNLLTPNDIAYRLDADRRYRGDHRRAGRGEGRPGRRASGCPAMRRRRADGWEEFDCSVRCGRATARYRSTSTHRDDPLLLYFTSGTVAYPKMVQHAHSYALGHVGTARFWHDLRPGDLHWTVTDTGWAKAAWGGLFGQMHERACIVQVALGRPDADTIFGILARHA